MSSSTESSTTRLTGEVVRSGDPGYAMARLGFNRLFAHNPAAIVYCAEADDVVNALRWAQHDDVPVRVRSGGHCLEGWSAVDDGLVIDVSRMKSANVDVTTGTATVGAGLTQLEAVDALGAAGVAAPTGIEGTVGLVGATLGGGLGLLTRGFGLASDCLAAADIVIATAGGGAALITADEENHQDLLWALRGAGNGNFGIVTSLTYRVHPLTQAVCVVATWRGLTELHRIFQTWQATAPHADTRLTTQLEIRRDEIVLFAVLMGGPQTEALDMLAPILGGGTPDITVQDQCWADTYAALQVPPADEAANWKFLSQFIYEPFPDEAIGLIGSFMAGAPTDHCNYFTNAFGGAVTTSEPSGGSAFAHRNALYYAEPGAGWGVRGGVPAAADPLTAQCQSWIAEFGQALSPYVNGAYVNVPNLGMDNWEAAYWESNIDRLRRVKAEYDPGDVFHYEQSIQAHSG